jgi:hypothetical protein
VNEKKNRQDFFAPARRSAPRVDGLMNFQDVSTSGPTAFDLRPFFGVKDSASAYSLRVRCHHILYSPEHRSPNPRIVVGHLIWEGTAALPFWAFVTLHSTSR